MNNTCKICGGCLTGRQSKYCSTCSLVASRSRAREWDRDNKERHLLNTRRSVLRNREQLAVYKRKFYEENYREQELVKRVCGICGVDLEGTKARKWCSRCAPEGLRIWWRNRYARLGKHFWLRGPDWDLQKYRAMSRDGHKCRCCGSAAKGKGNRLVVHHIVDWKDSGDNKLENLITLCLKCHSRGHKLNVFQWV